MHDEVEPDDLAAAVASMKRLNHHASRIAREATHALTDVTGFSLLGHSCEMARASGCALRIFAAAVPLLPGALDYAGRGVSTGGAERNRAHFASSVGIDARVGETMRAILWDPQTSGGLLIAAPPERAAAMQQRFTSAGEPLWAIGEVVEGEGVEVAA
jgi:selenide,water dikinase